jgi:hypothetical protein
MDTVTCISNTHGSGVYFTIGREYQVSRKGIKADDGFFYKDFLIDGNGETPAQKWVQWTHNTFLKFTITSTPYRRF